MHPSPLSQVRVVRAVMLVLFFLSMHATMGRADEEQPIIEIQGRFVHASKAQLDAALEIAGAGKSCTVLTPEQFERVRAKLTEAGADIFSEPRAITQSGQQAIVEIVKELPYPTKYEPSKKDPSKSVPIGFAMRVTGVTLEVEPLWESNGEIRLTSTPTFTRFLGFVDYSNLKQDEKNPPPLEDLLKAPLNAGEMWQPFFATFTVNRTFDLKDGQTAVMSGPVTIERRDSPSGRPVLESNSEAPEVLVFLTAKKVVRD